MIAKFSVALALAVLSFGILSAQTSAPIIVQAMPANPVATPKIIAAASVDSNQPALKILQEIKAANEAVLAKQAATLEQLDELEKAADQIKIFSKRG